MCGEGCGKPGYRTRGFDGEVGVTYDEDVWVKFVVQRGEASDFLLASLCVSLYDVLHNSMETKNNLVYTRIQFQTQPKFLNPNSSCIISSSL